MADIHHLPAAPPDPLTAFTRFWTIYPKQYGLGDARRQWIWALAAAGNDGETIISGARAYTAHIQREAVEWRYVLAPAKWLAGEHWKDSYDLPRSDSKPVNLRRSMEAKAAQGSKFAQDWLKRQP